MPKKPTQQIGNLDLIKDLNDSMETLNSYLENAGKMNEQFMEQWEEITSQQSEFNRSIIEYTFTLNQIISSNQQLNSLVGDRLDKIKAITDESEKALQNQEKHQQIEEQRKKADEKKQGEATSAIRDPMGFVGNKLSSSLKNVFTGKAGIIAAIGLEMGRQASKVVSDMRNISRTAGLGMVEGMEGLGNVAELEGQMRFAELSIPFLKEQYASKQEMQRGAGTMMGLGGMRGDEITEVFEFLPEKAYKAGVSFEAASQIMAQSNRILKQSPEEMERSFDLVVDTAREGGHAVEKFVQAVYKATFELAAYGTEQAEVTDMMKLFQNQVESGIMSEEERNKIIADAVRNYDDQNSRMEYLSDISEGLANNMSKGSEFMEIQNRIRQSLINVMEDNEAANVLATKAATRLTDATKDNSFNLDVLSRSAADLKEVFGMSDEEVLAWSETINRTSKSIGYDGAQLSGHILDMAKGIANITQDRPGSLSMANKVISQFIPELKNSTLSFSDLNNMTELMVERFDMTAGEIAAAGKLFVRVGRETDVSASKIANWTSQFAESTMDMFDSQEEAMANAMVSVSAFASAIDQGKVTISDFQEFQRQQMDIMSADPQQARGKFDFLLDIVEKTGIRMSELSHYTEDLASINRQYGYEQRAGTAVLAQFMQEIRSGTTDVQDLFAVMKGTTGGTPGFQAMVGEEFSGEVGGAFAGMDPLTRNLVMEQIQQGQMTDTLRETFGGTGIESLQRQLRSVRNRVMRQMLGEGSRAERAARLRALSGSIFGTQLGSRGQGVEDVLDLIDRGGDVDVESAIQEASVETERSATPLEQAYSKFGLSTDKFSGAVGTFSKAVSNMQKLFGKEGDALNQFLQDYVSNNWSEGDFPLNNLNARYSRHYMGSEGLQREENGPIAANVERLVDMLGKGVNYGGETIKLEATENLKEIITTQITRAVKNRPKNKVSGSEEDSGFRPARW